MVFSSVFFLHYFLPIAVAMGLLAHQFFGVQGSNLVLLVFSLVFYAWGLGSQFLWLLTLSISINFLLAIYAENSRNSGDNRAQFICTVLAVTVNIGILGYFKYANFFVEQSSALRSLIGLPPIIWTAVVLPIGISFFTFHQLSYVFDVQAGRSNALRRPIDLGLYICFFPQLIAGPIVRFHDIEDQLKSRSITADDLGYGALRFAHGLAKKVIIADPAGSVANACFSASSGDLTTGVAWLGALSYTIQIYFDFSGYSDMAIGLARVFGFKFPENFNRPYAALSVTDFWRRWHMTLSSWFRDYVYIPLGGSRLSSSRTYVNLMIVFILTGFWHGANWTFLVWGLLHGSLLIVERLIGVRVVEPREVEKMSLLQIALRRTAVMLFVIVGWVIFRADSMPKALDFLQAMFSFDLRSFPSEVAAQFTSDDLWLMALGIGLSLLPSTVLGMKSYTSDKLALRTGATAMLLLVALPLALIRVASGSYSPFLYFQF